MYAFTSETFDIKLLSSYTRRNRARNCKLRCTS